MGMNFPDLPTNGQVFGIYTWDGEKWVVTPTAPGGGALPSNTNPIMDGNAAPGVATPYARGDHVHPSDTTKAATTYVDTQDALKLSKSANLSDVADATTSRKSIYAAPFDALAYNGMQVNGSFDVDQPNAGAAYLFPPGSNFSQVMDGWLVTKAGTHSVNVQRAASTLIGPNELKLIVTTAQTSIGGGDFTHLRHAIEGYRTARLGWGGGSAVPVTVAFWVKSSVAGNILVSFYNSDFSAQSAVATVNIVSANVPQYVTVTIPGMTTGTWQLGNLTGLLLNIQILGNTASNIAATVGNTFEMAGVVVIPGTEAPSAARSPLIMRPYDQELLTCKRYYEKQNVSIFAYALASNTSMMIVPYLAEKRATPTVTAPAFGSSTNATGLAVYDITQWSAMVGVNAIATGNVGLRNINVIIDARL